MTGKYKSTQQRTTGIRGAVHLIFSHLGNTVTFVKMCEPLRNFYADVTKYQQSFVFVHVDYLIMMCIR